MGAKSISRVPIVPIVHNMHNMHNMQNSGATQKHTNARQIRADATFLARSSTLTKNHCSSPHNDDADATRYIIRVKSPREKEWEGYY